MKKVLLMCQQECHFELSPARYQLVYELKNNGYKVYVFGRCVIRDKNINGDIEQCVNTKKITENEIRNKIMNVQPNLVIATTAEDTQILYSLVRKMKQTVFVYYNLEINTLEEELLHHGENAKKIRYYGTYVKKKMKEVWYNRYCDMLVIQDSLRKKTLEKYFIHNQNTMLIPNSYVYNNDCMDNGERYGIIFSGGLRRNSLESLFSDINSFPDLPITFSGWGDDWVRKQIIKLHKMHPQIKLHEMLTNPDEFTRYLEKFAIGLIWYSHYGNDNADMIGLSSGKLFKHLSLGQPVITMDCPGLSSVVRKYRLGVVVHDVSELQRAYEHIMGNYSFYQRNVRMVYKDKFDYVKVIQPFIKYLEERL